MQPHDTDAPTLDGPAGRRQFLKLGGGAVLGAVVLAACADGEENLPAETGTTLPVTSTTLAPPQGTTPEDGAKSDASVTRTLRSFELAAVTAYGVLRSQDTTSTDPDAVSLPAPITYTSDVAEVLALMEERHTAHAEALESLVSAAGGEPVSEANQGVLGGILEPQLAGLTTEAAVVQFALSLEQIGAATHTWAAGRLTTAELRQQALAIGSVAARQSAVVSLLHDPSGGSAVSRPTLDTSGPARLPEAMFLQKGQDGGDVPAEPEAAAPAEGEDGEEGAAGGDEDNAEG